MKPPPSCVRRIRQPLFKRVAQNVAVRAHQGKAFEHASGDGRLAGERHCGVDRARIEMGLEFVAVGRVDLDLGSRMELLSQRASARAAFVSTHPMRTMPASPLPADSSSCRTALSRFTIWRARTCRSSPASVGVMPFPAPSKSSAPYSLSSSCMRRVSAGYEMCRRSAARERLPVSQTARNVLRRRMSMDRALNGRWRECRREAFRKAPPLHYPARARVRALASSGRSANCEDRHLLRVVEDMFRLRA